MPDNTPIDQPGNAETPLSSLPPNSSSSGNKMTVTIGLIVLLVVLVITSLLVFHTEKKSPSKSPSAPALQKITPGQVDIKNSGFVPATITIKVGQAVNWTNTDSAPHWVASDPYPTDDTLPGFNVHHKMEINDSFSYVFDKAGTYKYHDNLNPYTIQGIVIVK